MPQFFFKKKDFKKCAMFFQNRYGFWSGWFSSSSATRSERRNVQRYLVALGLDGDGGYLARTSEHYALLLNTQECYE